MLDSILAQVRRMIPTNIFNFFQPAYHWTLSFLAAVIYRFPSRYIKVIAVTGTKGKSSTVEIISAILEKSGKKTALSSTIHFKVAGKTYDNLYKMSMPGRFAMQRLIRRAVNQKCEYIVIEMTSQGALLFRHRFIELDTLVFTNLSPEHIEAHGSYENYVKSKLSVAQNMKRSDKPIKTIIANDDDKESSRFLSCKADRKISFKIKDVEPYEILKEGCNFTFHGKQIHSPLSGLFNLYNILAAITVAESEKIEDKYIIEAIQELNTIAGRVQKIEAGQDFKIIVDYAHTTDSLEKLYKVFEGSRKICVLGGTGGGRDTAKRSQMGHIADNYCDEIILTDEDPYDENPQKIVADVASGIKDHSPITIMDRREAIREALLKAVKDDVVLITGKGTDPYIMGPNGTKTPWSDANIAKEEMQKIISARKKLG